jgi:hypothetical protein
LKKFECEWQEKWPETEKSNIKKEKRNMTKYEKDSDYMAYERNNSATAGIT